MIVRLGKLMVTGQVGLPRTFMSEIPHACYYCLLLNRTTKQIAVVFYDSVTEAEKHGLTRADIRKIVRSTRGRGDLMVAPIIKSSGLSIKKRVLLHPEWKDNVLYFSIDARKKS